MFGSCNCCSCCVVTFWIAVILNSMDLQHKAHKYIEINTSACIYILIQDSTGFNPLHCLSLCRGIRWLWFVYNVVRMCMCCYCHYKWFPIINRVLSKFEFSFFISLLWLRARLTTHIHEHISNRQQIKKRCFV